MRNRHKDRIQPGLAQRVDGQHHRFIPGEPILQFYAHSQLIKKKAGAQHEEQDQQAAPHIEASAWRIVFSRFHLTFSMDRFPARG